MGSFWTHFSAQLRQLVAVAVERSGDPALIGGIEDFLFGPGPGGIREFTFAPPFVQILDLLTGVNIAGGRGPPTAGATARLIGARIGCAMLGKETAVKLDDTDVRRRRRQPAA